MALETARARMEISVASPAWIHCCRARGVDPAVHVVVHVHCFDDGCGISSSAEVPFDDGQRANRPVS